MGNCLLLAVIFGAGEVSPQMFKLPHNCDGVSSWEGRNMKENDGIKKNN